MQIVDEIILLLEDGQQSEALKKYKQVLKNGESEVQFDLGEKLFQLGFLEEAKSLFETLLKKYPEEGELLVFLAEIYLELDNENHALHLLESIQEQDSSFPQALMLLADLYQMQGLFEVSEQKILKAKKILPDEKIIDFALGELYAEQGKLTEAIESYQQVLNEATEIAGVNLNQRLAEVLSVSGKFEEALPYYDRALDEKLEINTLFGYAFTAYQAGYYRTAIEKFIELMELDPEYHSLYLYLARSYEQEGELEESFRIIKEGIKQDEFNKDLFHYAGKIALKLGQEEEAEELLRQALVLDPGFTEVALVLNKLFIQNEQYENVLDLVEYIETLDEEEPQFLWDAAISYQKTENYLQALNKYERAYTFFKNNTDFLEDYGYFLMEEGKTKEAAEIFNKLLKEDPSNEEYLEILERLV
ncbi:tetratricopeptide repeat protein [Bacillus sp. CGMCC 1.16607]|uniref:tetratricopeptide repeat protein n=1 Tax=Bacillus sp. CGMCC 1.16607 TaxID=3351842 RepID=UPI003635765A